MEKAVSFFRRSLTVLFAMVAWLGGSISGEPYIRSGDMEIARTLEFTYADGVSFWPGENGVGEQSRINPVSLAWRSMFRAQAWRLPIPKASRDAIRSSSPRPTNRSRGVRARP